MSVGLSIDHRCSQRAWRIGDRFSNDLFCASLVSSMLSVMGGVARNPAFGASIDGTT